MIAKTRNHGRTPETYTAKDQASGLPKALPIELVLISSQGLVGQAVSCALEQDPDVGAVTATDPAAIPVNRIRRADAVLLLAEGPADFVTAKRVRLATTKTPVIMCGWDENHDIDPWIKAGVNGFIPKSTRLSQFLPLVRAIISASCDRPAVNRV